MLRKFVGSRKSIGLVAVSVLGLCTVWFTPTSRAGTNVPSELDNRCITKCAAKQNACVLRCSDDSCILECAAKGQECIAACS